MITVFEIKQGHFQFPKNNIIMANKLNLLPAEEQYAAIKKMVIEKILAKSSMLTEQEIKDSSRFEEDLQIDSLDYVELVMEMERELGVSVPDQKIGYCKTLKAFVKAFVDHLGSLAQENTNKEASPATSVSNEDKVLKLVADISNAPQEQLNLEDNLEEDLELDSLDKMELITNCEKEFNISITDEETFKVCTVGDLIALINRKIN